MQTKYGNSALLLGAQGPTSFGLGTRQQLRLLDVDLISIDPTELYKSGGWVLSLMARNESAAAVPPPNTPSASLGTIGVVATITMGAGGAAIPFQITVGTGTVLLVPSGALSVDVELASNGGIDMRVMAIVQRGFAVSNATFTTPLTLTSAAAVSGPIPNFATGLIVDSQPESVWYSNNLRFLLGSDTFLGPDLKGSRVRANYLAFPRGTRVWTVTPPAATEVTYGVPGNFTGNLIWRIEP